MAVKKTKSVKVSNNTESVMAKSDDGNIQITFTIPWKTIVTSQNKAAEELGKNIQVPGFRKGKAPITKLIEHIPQNTLLEKTLSTILPGAVDKAIKKFKIKPSIYPKFELISAKTGEDWQIRALTCELPKVKLGNYKSHLNGLGETGKIWTPGSNVTKSDKEQKEKSREEKEQEVIATLLQTSEFTIPKLLINEEADSRLSKLLERIEKLGLTLESYLQSIGKTADTLRKEYEEQAKNALALDLILTEVAKSEDIKADDTEVNEAIKAASADKKLAKDLDTPEKRRYLEVILTRRKALNHLTSLI